MTLGVKTNKHWLNFDTRKRMARRKNIDFDIKGK